MSDPELKPPASNQPLRPPQVVSLAGSAGGLQLPVTAPQKLNGSASSSASGSATGNPRNKCALKPGYSLMSWIRLCNSGADLSGTGGRVVPVSRTELALHNKIGDAWMAIRGCVFNVTRYMDFHPGGVDELMRGVGRDATKLFDEVHAWVNYPQLLGKCYVGPLKENESKQSKDSPQITNVILKPPEIVPRFDWIQQRSELTLIFYTRSLINPGLLIRQKDSQQLAVRVLVQNNWHCFDFQLTNKVKWPPKVAKIGAETGKIEVVFGKAEEEPWSTYGTHVSSKLSSTSIQEESYDYEVILRNDFNHDSFELQLKSVQPVLMLLPVGYHVDIEVHLDGDIIQRSYTPVDEFYSNLDKKTHLNSECLNFLIKRYTDGPVSSHLHQLQVGSHIQLSPPRGNFQLSELTAHRNILLLAAGSGLTPILSLIQPILKRSTNRIESLKLFYFNKTTEDIWLKEKLEEIHLKDERFSCTNFLSQAESNPQRISLELLTPMFQKKQPDCCTYIAICGPSGFNNAAVDILTQLEVKPNQLHVFRG
ncbi:cytochrome b5 reductase 4 [Drosophila ficusphila]|uniref:cytochrome b5 reductase 4 n=1 Tax=Drosophila ficusphila TaxID=30025 RepID=UPI0007E6EBA4|nr:cytochrome b5 reductase 4 [Drosophila ficusphila]